MYTKVKILYTVVWKQSRGYNAYRIEKNHNNLQFLCYSNNQKRQKVLRRRKKNKLRKLIEY